jgi:hypothetical protein
MQKLVKSAFTMHLSPKNHGFVFLHVHSFVTKHMKIFSLIMNLVDCQGFIQRLFF